MNDRRETAKVHNCSWKTKVINPVTTETEVKTRMPNLTRQKISAVIRKSGVPASTSSKGRVSWRVSDGYDLELWVPTYGGGYLRKPFTANGKIARVKYWGKGIADETEQLRKIQAAFRAEGWPTEFDEKARELWLLGE